MGGTIRSWFVRCPLILSAVLFLGGVAVGAGIVLLAADGQAVEQGQEQKPDPKRLPKKQIWSRPVDVA